MSGRLTTHVLDIVAGRPAAGMTVRLWELEGTDRRLRAEVVTNADGRTAAPLLAGDALRPGLYELVFEVAAYFGIAEREAFLGSVPVRFRVVDAGAPLHVPLIVSPWAFSTYRGS